MSPLLAVAIVLLVIVVGLTLLQRRTQAQPPTRRLDTSPAAPPPTPPPARPVRAPDLYTDPLLGPMSHDGDLWMAEDDLVLGDIAVLVEISGTIDGPTEEDREFVRAALARADLEPRARAMVQAELARRGISADGITIYELAVGPDDDGVRSGYIWYNVPDLMAEIGVKSTDHWRTLTLEVVE
jgi:hypothetical protein